MDRYRANSGASGIRPDVGLNLLGLGFPIREVEASAGASAFSDRALSALSTVQAPLQDSCLLFLFLDP